MHSSTLVNVKPNSIKSHYQLLKEQSNKAKCETPKENPNFYLRDMQTASTISILWQLILK